MIESKLKSKDFVEYGISVPDFCGRKRLKFQQYFFVSTEQFDRSFMKDVRLFGNIENMLERYCN